MGQANKTLATRRLLKAWAKSKCKQMQLATRQEPRTLRWELGEESQESGWLYSEHALKPCSERPNSYC